MAVRGQCVRPEGWDWPPEQWEDVDGVWAGARAVARFGQRGTEDGQGADWSGRQGWSLQEVGVRSALVPAAQALF